MDRREQRILDEMIVENNDDHIRRKLVEKYNAYYRHWQDYTIMVAVFAIISLFLGIYQWEIEFSLRGADGRQLPKEGFFTDLIITIVSLMGIFAIIFKYYFESVWQNFKNPVMFYK